jgi:hypothetical protein
MWRVYEAGFVAIRGDGLVEVGDTALLTVVITERPR